MIQHWKLDDWMKRIEKVEDIFAPIIESKKTGYDIDNVLIYNYAKIVLCLREILTLLKHGFPDGALSIARTVYEYDILTEFIYSKYKENGASKLLECYFVDHNVKAYKCLKELHEEISKIPKTSKEFKNMVSNLEMELQKLKAQYGRLNGQYWWAKSEFNDKLPTFSMIDNLVNDDFLLRIIYKRACISVHASAIGSSALLGRSNEDGNMIYTTQTNEGFEAALLLGMISHDRIVEIMCDCWKINVEDILSDMREEYEKYIEKFLK